MSLEIKFCPNCNNILNITKTNTNKNKIGAMEVDTPNTISDTEEDDDEDMESKKDNSNEVDVVVFDAVDNLIEKIINGTEISEVDLVDLKYEQIIRHKSYVKLDKKTKMNIQTKLVTFFEKIEDSTSAYYHCVICSYTKAIEPKTIVSSRIGTNSTEMYINIDKLQNKTNHSILPRTRNYICINNKCESHNNHEKREAVMYRIGSGVQVWYTCCECKSYWKGE
jgi:hypothetical protein